MLRWMSMHNFIHFTQPQRLNFDDGVNFIIGGNSSGKTAVFELIRRSLSNKLSTSTSSIPQSDQLAYTICYFHTPEDKMPPWEVDENISTPPKAVIACLFVSPVTSEDNASFYYKMCITISDVGQYKIFGQRFRSSGNCYIENLHSPSCCSRKTCTKTTAFVEKIYNPNSATVQSGKDPVHDDVIRFFHHKIELLDFYENETRNTYVNIMFEWLTDGYVGVLPMRSIGPLQWTRSSLINPANGEKNYQRASSQAEILTELLDDKNKDYINWNIAETYRRHLVYPYSFRKDGNDIVVDNTHTHFTRPLLKIPEGVVEAEQLILLLSDKRNLTITLEEPDRGMHPHMINRLRDWVLKRVVNKTVLIISHHPSMLDHLTIDRTYLCTKSRVVNSISQDVRKLPGGYRKYGMVEEMKCLLFSERVLFVEGFTDQIIVEAMFDVVVNGNLEPLENMGFLSDETYKEFISSLHVIDLREGKGAGPKKMRFCKDIERESFILYDFDLVLKKGDNSKIKINADTDYQIEFNKQFNNIQSFRHDENAFSDFERACEKANTFVWIEKALENVINQVSTKIDREIAKQLDIPITNYRTWKHNLINKDEKEIKHLAVTLIKHSPEVQRFLLFFGTMMLRVDDMKTTNKRKHSENIDQLSAKKNKAVASTSEVKSDEIGQGQHDCESSDSMDENNHKSGLSQEMRAFGF